MKKEVILKTAAVIFIAVMSLFCVEHTDKAAAAVGYVVSVLFPIILGLGMAFIINIPMSGIERAFLRLKKGKISEQGRKTLRTVSLNLAVLIIAAVVAFVLFLVIPELARSLGGLVTSLSELPDKLSQKRSAITGFSPTLAYYIYDYDKQELIDRAADWAANGSVTVVGFAWSAVRSAAMVIYYIIAAFIIMMSILREKERVGAQVKKVLASYLAAEKLEKILGALKNISEVFSKFITGQCLEACILGSMFFVSMSLLRLPYALIVSSLITLTALIPIFGAFIGLAVGALLIFIDTPSKAIWFVVLFFVLQQLENNLIYPKVVGGSVGLPPLWTLLAVIIGGDLLGIIGMIFFIPVFSVIYSSLSNFANRKSSEKNGDDFLEKVT